MNYKEHWNEYKRLADMATERLRTLPRLSDESFSDAWNEYKELDRQARKHCAIYFAVATRKINRG